MQDIGFQITILLFATMLSLVIAKRIGQSAILGMIVIGAIIGPTVLGWVEYTETVHILAELGAIFMLFTIGLECNYKEVYNIKNTAIALFGVVIPFVAGWGISRLFGYTTLEGMFIGTALTATSIAITARVLQDKCIISSPVAKTIIGAAVVDDVLGLIVLSVITGLTGTFHLTDIAIRVGVALGFVLGCVLLIKPINIVMRKIDAWAVREEMHQLTLFAAMVVAFAYAGIASYIGMSSIVGAFLAGVTLEELRIKSYREGAVYFEMLFSAIFFVSLGIIADLSHLGGAWLFALVVIVVAVVSKYVGCFLPARVSGLTWKEASAVGIGMVPRGEVAMIVGLLGLTAGIITQEIYGVIIVMAFATTIITPMLLNWTLPTKSAEN